LELTNVTPQEITIGNEIQTQYSKTSVVEDEKVVRIKLIPKDFEKKADEFVTFGVFCP